MNHVKTDSGGETIMQSVHKLRMQDMTTDAIIEREHGPFPVTIDPHVGFPTLFQCLGVEYKPDMFEHFSLGKPQRWSGNLYAIEFLSKKIVDLNYILNEYVLQRIAARNLRSADHHHMLAWFGATPTVYRSLLGIGEDFVPAREISIVPLGSEHGRVPGDPITTVSFQIEARLGQGGAYEHKSLIEYDASLDAEHWLTVEHEDDTHRHFFLAVSD